MKNIQKGSLGIIVIVLIALVVTVGGSYIYSTQKTHITTTDTQANDSTNISISTTTNTDITKNLNMTGLSDAVFLAAVGDPEAKILAKGDVNGDGYEDAVVQEVHCGASCSISLQVILNQKNMSAKLVKDDNYPDTFSPAYKASSATKSEVEKVSIKNGIISLTGKGLACTASNSEDVCTEEKWNVAKTVIYKFDGTNIIQLSVHLLSEQPIIKKGDYEFHEFSRGLNGQTQTWTYKLHLKNEGGVGKISLTVDGFQTMTNIYATGVLSSQGLLDVIFESYGQNNMYNTSYKNGDILFTLKPIYEGLSDGLSIEWKKMQPILDQTKVGTFIKISN